MTFNELESGDCVFLRDGTTVLVDVDDIVAVAPIKVEVGLVVAELRDLYEILVLESVCMYLRPELKS